MSRDELVKKIAASAGISQKVASAALNAVLEGITESLKKGDKVSLVGFGSFSVAHRKARNGINPKTKKPLKIPARNVPSSNGKKARAVKKPNNSVIYKRRKPLAFCFVLTYKITLGIFAFFYILSLSTYFFNNLLN